MKIDIQRVLCPTDFSASADHALLYAVAIAKRHGAAVELLHVAQPSAYAGDAINEQGQTHGDSVRDRLRKRAEGKGEPGMTVTVNVVDGIDYMEIVNRAAAWPADLIVLGTHGRTGIKHLLIGSVAERVVRTAACPVCTVRHPEHALSGSPAA